MSACKYIHRCPSASEWCNEPNPTEECANIFTGIIFMLEKGKENNEKGNHEVKEK